MTTHSILWRRLDGPGQDACRLEHTATGWNLASAGYCALLEVSASGFVLDYPCLWHAEQYRE